MKKQYLYISILVLFFNNSFAQNTEKFKSYYFITASPCLSLKSFTASRAFKMPTKSTTVFDVAMQFQPSVNISFGASFSAQRFTSFDKRNRASGKSYFITTLYNPGILASYCYPISTKVNFYAQVKLNYQLSKLQYQYSDNASGVTSRVTLPLQNPNQYNLQFGLGGNFYISKYIGFHLEGAIGNPYMIKIGINYRFFSGVNSVANERKIERVEPLKGKPIYN